MHISIFCGSNTSKIAQIGLWIAEERSENQTDVNVFVLLLTGLDCDCGLGLHCSCRSGSKSEILGLALLRLTDQVFSLKLKWIVSGSIINSSRLQVSQQQRLEERTTTMEGVGLRTCGRKGDNGRGRV